LPLLCSFQKKVVALRKKTKKMPPSILPITLPSGFTFEMILVEGGTFQMGDDQSEFEREKPEHLVTVNSFYLGKYQVPQALWEDIMGNNPSGLKGEDRPVERVSWEDAKFVIQKLNDVTQKSFKLPSEAEWEFAARGGIYSQGYQYAGSDKLSQVGWYGENSENQTHEVGLLLPNELGIYDMSGNVYEWCEDDWHATYDEAPRDGKPWIDAPDRGTDRVLRGGGCFDSAVDCRPAFRLGVCARHSRRSGIGFRLALPLQSAG
jgi:sulfatase modifying factor 1